MATKTEESLVLVSNSNGIVIIPEKSPLKRLNYFDGKFLRASDLKDEQDYLRHLVRLSNQAGGFGVVHGFDLTLGGGDTIDLGPGLGINGNGHVLLLPQGLSISIQELIEKSLQKAQKKGGGEDVSEFFEECVLVAETPPVNNTNPSDLYLIVICPAEALCGEEDVYGKLCEEACATSSDRPFAVEGVIVRAVPLVLQTPLPHSKIVPIATKKHLRSRVASAYFEDERHKIASMISKFGLAQQVWCLGADAASGACLPIGVIARAGAATVFLDPWIARRERMDSSPRRYWQWRMMMRPWDVFLAQILQFQCQLRDLFGGDFTPEGQDPCGDAQTVIGEAAQKIAEVVQVFKDANLQIDVSDQAEMFSVKMLELENMSQKLTATGEQMTVLKGNRLLIQGGIIELPSAGYLPVAPNANETVNEQVRRLMGEGVDLRFCVVRPDFVAHALEEAQHMERISLIEGLEDEKKKPKVDILVPDGEVVAETQPDTRVVFAAEGPMQSSITSFGETQSPKTVPLPPIPFKGAARSEKLTSGGTAVYLSCASLFPSTPLSKGLDVAAWKQLATITGVNTGAQPQLGLWMTLRSDKELLLLKPGEVTNVDAELVIGFVERPGFIKTEFRAELNGLFTAQTPIAPFSVSGTLAGKFSIEGLVFTPRSENRNFSLSLRQPSPATIEIVLGVQGKFQLVVEADWTNPAQVKTNVKTAITPLSAQIPKFEMALPLILNKDPNIFSVTNTNHVGAMAALTIVGAALKEQTFVADKTKVLFPPPAPAQTAQAIRATRDWVLFHRRRTKQCEVVGATRTYQIYEAVVPVGTRDNPVPPAPPTVAELLQVSDDQLKPFVPIGVVSFNAGGSTPIGDLAALKAAWKKVPGGAILWAGIASRGDAKNDGDSLAAARLTALESQLDQVDPAARADVLPLVPPPLESTANDGIIVFIVGARQTYYAYASALGVIGGKNL